VPPPSPRQPQAGLSEEFLNCLPPGLKDAVKEAWPRTEAGKLPESVRSEVDKLPDEEREMVRGQLRMLFPVHRGPPPFGPPWKRNHHHFKHHHAPLPPFFSPDGMGKGCDSKKMLARFVSHVTFPDETVVAPGENFLKVWRVRNDCAFNWSSAPFLINVSGISDALYHDPVPSNLVLGPNEEGAVSVSLTAPTKPGLYESFFRLADSITLKKFGQRLRVSIIVKTPDEEENKEKAAADKAEEEPPKESENQQQQQPTSLEEGFIMLA